jgi:hypothetical protein
VCDECLCECYRYDYCSQSNYEKSWMNVCVNVTDMAIVLKVNSKNLEWDGMFMWMLHILLLFSK